MSKAPSICFTLVLGAFLATATQAAAPKLPAVLFAGSEGGGCGYEQANRLAQAGFVLRAENAHPLTWDRLKNYNVVVSGLGMANADMSLGRTQQTIDALNRYLQAGGGVLVFGSFGQANVAKPPQDAFLKPIGLTALFDEMPDDPKTAATATAWKIRFAPANAITESPVTADVKTLWYPVPRDRIGAQNHTISFVADSSWQVLIRGSESSLTRKGALQDSSPSQPGTYKDRVPLAAIRQVGKGRIMYLGITQEYLVGVYANSTLEGIVLDRGLNQTPSHGYTLLANGLRWLAEPSLADGQLGGAAMQASLLDNPNKVRVGRPYAWPAQINFPAIEPALPGLIGARTSYSSGKATADQWADKAKAAGLAWIVFLEDFTKLSAEDFQKLKADCARLSSADFAAIPGLAIDDEVGNHYFYCNSSCPYPERKFLTENGKAFRSRNTQIKPKDPYIPGQLAMTTLDFAYSNSSFKLTAGNSQRYILNIDGKSSACFSGQLEGKLVSSLPIAVSNLNDRWSACLYDRILKRSRPIGVFRGSCLGHHHPARPRRRVRRPSRPGRSARVVRPTHAVRRQQLDFGDPQPRRCPGHHPHPPQPRLRPAEGQGFPRRSHDHPRRAVDTQEDPMSREVTASLETRTVT